MPSSRRIVHCSRPDIAFGQNLVRVINEGHELTDRVILRLITPHVVYANSASRADVLAAIASASPGDTVMVPSGDATWSATLFNKGVILKGAGVGLTNITFSGSGVGYGGGFCLEYSPSNYSLNAPFRMTGFTFDFNGVGSGFALGFPDNERVIYTIQNKVRIDHNHFIDPTNQWIWNACKMYGVVDNNTFDGSWYGFKNDAQGWEDFWWMNAPHNEFAVGSEKYIYYEDNVINLIGSDNACMEGQYNGRYVARYNTVTGANSSSTFEFHGHQTDGAMGSCFGGETYGNNISMGRTGGEIHKIRGGQHMSFYNNVIGSGAQYNNAYVGSMVTCSSYHPELQIVHDTYWWQNRVNYSGSLFGDLISGSYNCAGLTGLVTGGRDVMSNSTSPGVTAGPLANRPANPVLHQGYWATDQSITNLTGMVGRNPSTPIVGTLYFCKTAGVWTDSYTPYTYPHPLRSDPVVGD